MSDDTKTEISIASYQIDDAKFGNSHRIEVVDSQGRRKYTRFLGEITAVLSTDHMTFRTSTINISGGGARFRDLIPREFVDRPFDCLFIAESDGERKEYLIVRGVTLDSPLRSSRIKFLQTPSNLTETLHSLFT